MGEFAVVTGGSTGIGRHLVSAFADAGYAVAFSYRHDDDAAQSLVEAIEEAGGQALGLGCDVGRRAEVEAFFDEACDWFGDAPDVLVNNAGIQTWAPLLELSEEGWDDVIRTNLKGCFLNTQAAAKRMVEADKGGAIVNIGSGCNKLAFPKLVSYTASKGGIEQLTKASAVELGPTASVSIALRPVLSSMSAPRRNNLIMRRAGLRSRRYAGLVYRRIFRGLFCSSFPMKPGS